MQYTSYQIPEMEDRTLELYRLHNMELPAGTRVHGYNPDGPWAYTAVLTAAEKILTFEEFLEGQWKTWMSTSPLEMASVGASAALARGHVLVGGLGLGMFPWIAAQQPWVYSVTVFEIEQKVIDLVKPYMDPESKIYIINQDIYEADGAGYDYIYLDIWRDAIGVFQEFDRAQDFMRNVGKVSATRRSWLDELVLAARSRSAIPNSDPCAVCNQKRRPAGVTHYREEDIPVESRGLLCNTCSSSCME